MELNLYMANTAADFPNGFVYMHMGFGGCMYIRFHLLLGVVGEECASLPIRDRRKTM